MFAAPLGRSTFTPPKSSFDSPLYGLVSLRRSQQTRFRGAKSENWEGGHRVPLVIRWPGVIELGTRYNDIMAMNDWMPTLAAAAGESDLVEKMKDGYNANGKDWEVHLDGHNFLPYFRGEVEKGPRESYLYFGMDGTLNAVRWNDFKAHFNY